ncbi:MAG: hypothetical protein ACE5HX_13225 [bacterium]
MNSIFKFYIKQLWNNIRLRNSIGINFRKALGISLFLHLFGAVAVASFFVGHHLIAPVTDEITIEFDLVNATNTDIQKNKNNATNPLNTLSSQNAPDSESPKSKSSHINRNEVIMASLASLSELKESFNFITQQVSWDSLGTFSPIQSEAPDIKSLTAGLNNGNGFGHKGRRIRITGGGGKCPPGDGGILK